MLSFPRNEQACLSGLGRGAHIPAAAAHPPGHFSCRLGLAPPTTGPLHRRGPLFVGCSPPHPPSPRSHRLGAATSSQLVLRFLGEENKPPRPVTYSDDTFSWISLYRSCIPMTTLSNKTP